jgi:transposase InsO family protein
VRRFEWPCPDDLVQMDVKQFVRFSVPGHAVTGDRSRSAARKRDRVGYEFAHSLLDDHSRFAYTKLHKDQRAETVVGFVERALTVLAAHGIEPKRLQTDNAWAYSKNRALAQLLAARAIEHRRIPPRTPKRNGKVERYQQTLKREWGFRKPRHTVATRRPRLPR